jgi:hypothetical protein
MKYRNNCGQEAIEFVLICALIFFAAVFGFMIMGDKLAGFFMNDSATVKVASQNAPVIKTSSSLKYGNNYTTAATVSDKPLYEKQVTTTETINTGNYGSFTQNPDGTYNIELESGKAITGLSTNFYEQFEQTVVKTTGSSGANMFMYLLNSMISDYVDSNPGVQDIPLDIKFGNGSWTSDKHKVSGSGGSQIYTFKVGDKVTMYYKEQTTSIDYVGSIVFPATIDANGNLYVESYYQDVNLNNPAASNYGGYKQGTLSGTINSDGTEINASYNDIYRGGDKGTFHFEYTDSHNNLIVN